MGTVQVQDGAIFAVAPGAAASAELEYLLDAGAKLAEGTPRQIMDDPAVVEAYFGTEGRQSAAGSAPTQTGDGPRGGSAATETGGQP